MTVYLKEAEKECMKIQRENVKFIKKDKKLVIRLAQKNLRKKLWFGP